MRGVKRWGRRREEGGIGLRRWRRRQHERGQAAALQPGLDAQAIEVATEVGLESRGKSRMAGLGSWGGGGRWT